MDKIELKTFVHYIERCAVQKRIITDLTVELEQSAAANMCAVVSANESALQEIKRLQQENGKYLSTIATMANDVELYKTACDEKDTQLLKLRLELDMQGKQPPSPAETKPKLPIIKLKINTRSFSFVNRKGIAVFHVNYVDLQSVHAILYWALQIAENEWARPQLLRHFVHKAYQRLNLHTKQDGLDILGP